MHLSEQSYESTRSDLVQAVPSSPAKVTRMLTEMSVASITDGVTPFLTRKTDYTVQAATNAAAASSHLDDDEDADLAAAIAASLAGADAAPATGSNADSVHDATRALEQQRAQQQQPGSSAQPAGIQPSSNAASAGVVPAVMCTVVLSVFSHAA